jgi:hypothetical protein
MSKKEIDFCTIGQISFLELAEEVAEEHDPCGNDSRDFLAGVMVQVFSAVYHGAPTEEMAEELISSLAQDALRDFHAKKAA